MEMGQREKDAWEDWEETTKLRKAAADMLRAVIAYHAANGGCLLVRVGDAVRELTPAIAALGDALPTDKHLRDEIDYWRSVDVYYEDQRRQRNAG